MPILSVMDTRAAGLGSDPEFRPPSTLYDALATPTNSPSMSSAGSMNYSPKHSRKPLSLLSLRNINMKNLLLNLSPSTNSSTTLPPRRGKSLALAIPAAQLPTVLTSLQAQHDQISSNGHAGVSTPLHLTHNTSFEAPLGRFMHLLPNSVSDVSQDHLPDKLDMSLRGPMLLSPFESMATSAAASRDNLNLEGKPLEKLALERHNLGKFGHGSENFSNGYTGQGSNGESQEYTTEHHRFEQNPHSSNAPHGSLLSRPQNFLSVPEELQEQSNLHAYPDGPANVLNSRLYLYSDPRDLDCYVEINDFDLIINVAKECTDLSLEFLTAGGKKYVYVPWSHTSLILQTLPELTATISEYDVPGKKILIHCQCGVSRSACVIVAYFMVKFHISVNEAYELLKSGTESTEPCNQEIASSGNFVQACDRICPNMSLIFELMDFGERLAGKGK